MNKVMNKQRKGINNTPQVITPRPVHNDAGVRASVRPTVGARGWPVGSRGGRGGPVGGPSVRPLDKD